MVRKKLDSVPASGFFFLLPPIGAERSNSSRPADGVHAKRQTISEGSRCNANFWKKPGSECYRLSLNQHWEPSGLFGWRLPPLRHPPSTMEVQ